MSAPARRAGSLEGAGPVELRRRAMDLLARREHGRAELARKLAERGADPGCVATVLDTLEADGLLSEARFVEAFVEQQLARGKGPVAIEHGLRQRGAAEPLVSEALAALEIDWLAAARREREKRFGSGAPRDFGERARQARFLRARGFTGEQVHRVLGQEDGGAGGIE